VNWKYAKTLIMLSTHTTVIAVISAAY